MKIITTLERFGRTAWTVVGLLLLCVVAYLDYVTGNELSFSFFYLIPIAILTWVTNSSMGILIALISAGIWLAIDMLSGAKYSSPLIYFWNTLIRFSFFLILVFLLKLGKAWEFEKGNARTDFLTGAMNRRWFNELIQIEIHRSQRFQHPLTIAMIDIDNFKAINDQFGHSTGDKVLVTVAQSMMQKMRKTDIVARLGGDEFAVVLPETNGDAIQAALAKMQQGLETEMQSNQWPVTFSIGVMTFTTMPNSPEEMLNIVDKIMYSVKENGKNNIFYMTDAKP